MLKFKSAQNLRYQEIYIFALLAKPKCISDKKNSEIRIHAAK